MYIENEVLRLLLKLIWHTTWAKWSETVNRYINKQTDVYIKTSLKTRWDPFAFALSENAESENIKINKREAVGTLAIWDIEKDENLHSVLTLS